MLSKEPSQICITSNKTDLLVLTLSCSRPTRSCCRMRTNSQKCRKSSLCSQQRPLPPKMSCKHSKAVPMSSSRNCSRDSLPSSKTELQITTASSRTGLLVLTSDWKLLARVWPKIKTNSQKCRRSSVHWVKKSIPSNIISKQSKTVPLSHSKSPKRSWRRKSS